MTESFPFVDDCLSFLFALFGEFIDVLHRTPVCDVSHFAFPEDAVEHATTGEQANSALVQWQHWAAGQFLLFAHKHPPRILRRRRTLQGIFENIQ